MLDEYRKLQHYCMYRSQEEEGAKRLLIMAARPRLVRAQWQSDRAISNKMSYVQAVSHAMQGHMLVVKISGGYNTEKDARTTGLAKNSWNARRTLKSLGQARVQVGRHVATDGVHGKCHPARRLSTGPFAATEI